MEDLDLLLSNVNFNMIVPVDQAPKGRFEKISSEDVDKFLESQENENTKRKTLADLKLLNQFLAEEGEMRPLEEIEPATLDDFLCKFIITVRKKDGTEYEPSSIRNFFSSFERYLKRKSYGFCLISGIEFSKCRATLKAKQKDLKAQGKGNKPRASDELTDDDINCMYASGTLGLFNGTSLLHSMWAICTLNFGMRTGKEIHNMRWGDVELRTDENDEEYLIFSSEIQSKTRTGDNTNDIRRKPRAYSIPEDPNRDPVALYKKYRDERPQSMLTPESPFFLAINHAGKPGSPWYKSNPMGLNKLYGIMKDMKKGTNITEDKRITPYSMRKHLVQKLMDEGVATNQIMEITGHKNTNSISNYSHLKPEQQKKISNILCNRTSRPVASTVTSPPEMSTSGAAASLSFTSNQLAQQSFLSSIMSNNTINGNVNICISPNAFGFSAQEPLQSDPVPISLSTSHSVHHLLTNEVARLSTEKLSLKELSILALTIPMFSIV